MQCTQGECVWRIADGWGLSYCEGVLGAHCRRWEKQTDVYSLLKYKLEAQVKIAKPNEQFGR